MLADRCNRDGEVKHLNLRMVYAALEDALAGLGLPEMTFCQAGWHTFASLRSWRQEIYP